MAGSPAGRARPAVWWRPFAGAAVAAGVAAIAVVALQQRAIAPALRAASPVAAVATGVSAGFVQVAQTSATAGPREALSYTVPAMVSDVPAALPAARLTNYVFAHSKYSSVLGQNDVLNDLLSEADPEDAAAAAAAVPRSPGMPVVP